MNTSHAQPLPDDDTEGQTAEPRRKDHLKLVTNEFVNSTAAASGASPESVLEAMALLTVEVTDETSDSEAAARGWRITKDWLNRPWHEWLPYETEAPAVSVDLAGLLRVTESLTIRFRDLSERLRAEQGTLIPSSEVRAHWSDMLDRVRDGEILYVTHHGERVAALVPPDVADFYRDAEDKADAAAIGRADAEDSTSGEQPVLLEDLIAELGL